MHTMLYHIDRRPSDDMSPNLYSCLGKTTGRENEA